MSPQSYYPILGAGSAQRSGTDVTITGSGDIAPAVATLAAGNTDSDTLLFGIVVALIVVIVIAGTGLLLGLGLCRADTSGPGHWSVWGLPRHARVSRSHRRAPPEMAPARPGWSWLGSNAASPSNAAPTTGDPVLIESTVTNLLDNAMQHNLPDGTVELTTGRLSAGSRLSVRNSGPIVPAAEVERFFQPFQRLGHDRTGSGDGHGLGLAIVQAIGRAHRAMVTAQPLPQGGLDIEISFSSPDSIAAVP